jgi:hypothetical protein
MTSLPDRFIEDRALRDAARVLLTDDLTRLRENLGEQGIASRVSSSVSSTITGRLRAGARDVLAQAQAQAGDHKGVLALLVGAIILFFARGPIIDWLDDSAESDDVEDDATAPPPEFDHAPASEGDPV